MATKSIITLSQAQKTKYFRISVQIQVHIAGKAILPYQVPKKIQIICEPKQGQTCKKCSVKKEYDKHKRCFISIDEDDPNLIKFINTGENLFNTIIRNICHIPNRCQFKFEVMSVYTVEEVYMSEMSSEKPTSSMTRIGYCINKSLECNTPYLITCYTFPEPKTQKIVHVITEADKLKTSIESFELSKKNVDDLNIFNPLYNAKNPVKNDDDNENDNEVQMIYDFLHKLYDIYAGNITRIYKRFDLHMAIDLAFHSPLQFYFNNELVYKGWMDIMIIGDTRCGKGFVSENLVKYYGFGEVVSGENASFAGLVGGIQQISGRWVATWGRIPLNNKRLLIIDESGEMDPKDFSRLSRIRSEGIAEIAKIHAERTQAMTRLIFLTNPKNRMVSTYSFGIEAINDLVENAEDISRFDYILVVAQNEVDINEINQTRKVAKNIYTEYDPTLVQWIWSRNAKQVIFEDKTTDLILKYAIKLGKIYSSKIPLIQGENIRVKLAKISASIAGRLFSHRDDCIIVKPAHVKAAYVFINLIYKKPCSGYFHLSQLQLQMTDIYNIANFEEYINSFENRPDLVHYFVQNNYITVTDLSECLNQPKEVAREIISKLIHHRCIQKRYAFYVKNKCFTDWLRQH